MNTGRIVGIAGFIVSFLVACGDTPKPASSSSSSKSSSTPAPGGGDKDDKDDSDDGSDTETGEGEACVAKDAKANEKGVGAYCDKTVRCAKGFICTGDFGAPVGAQFCTTPCADDSDCGSGAHCFAEERGKGCVLDACQAE